MVRAAVTFLLTDPETFSYRVIRAGEQIPDWALDSGLVTHPDIFGDAADEREFVGEVDDDGGADDSEEDQADEDDVSRETDVSEEDSDAEEYADLEEELVEIVEDEEDDQPRPDGSWKKAEILEYAMSNNIQVTGSETKDQLLELVEES